MLGSYSFRENGMALELAFRFRALVPLTSVELWLGTGDDWLGASDATRKERGQLGFDAFRAMPEGKALRVRDSGLEEGACDKGEALGMIY